MPIENERKYVLPLDFDPQVLGAWRRSEIKQAYLDDGPRLRQTGSAYLFTYKRLIPQSGELIEIETEISAEDFSLLWSQCTIGLSKTRYEKTDASGDWVVDFLRDKADRLYFVLAEVELPRGAVAPEAIPDELAPYVIHAVDAADMRFTNKKLADAAVAARLYSEIETKR